MADLLPLIPNPGSERDPKNFVGRAEVFERALNMLSAKQNILLSDPRRMGKSFWLQTFVHQMENGTSYRAIYVDYQGVNSLEEFLTETARALAASNTLPERFAKRLAAFFDNVDIKLSTGALELKSAIRSSPKTSVEILNELIIQLDSDLEENRKKAPLLIVMDEVSDAVWKIADDGRPNEAKNLLQRLQHLRKNTKNIRWIIAGSIGFHHVLALVRSSTNVIIDLNTLKFGPLMNADAELLARRLALGINRPISQDALTFIVEITNGFPALIQKLFDMMLYDQEGQSAAGTQIESSEIEQRLEDFITDRDNSRDVTHYTTRIDLYYLSKTKMALSILNIMARKTGYTPYKSLKQAVEKSLGENFDEEQFINTIGMLCDDHYLVEQRADGSSKVAWRYPIIQRIYQRRKKLV